MDVIHLLTPSAPRPIAPFSHAFQDGKLPARTCIGVTALAGGAGVEIDLLAVTA
jgi:enamine deaminase RidA (YjgF/YER057c/UK114 family)